MADPVELSFTPTDLDDMARKMRVCLAAGCDRQQLIIGGERCRELIAAIEGRPAAVTELRIVTVEKPAPTSRGSAVFWGLVLALYLQALLTPAAEALVQLLAGLFHG